MLSTHINSEKKMTSPADYLLMRLPRMPYRFSQKAIADMLVNLNERDAWILVDITERGYHLNRELMRCYINVYYSLKANINDSAACLTDVSDSLSRIFSDVYNSVYNDDRRDEISSQIASYTLDLICQNKNITLQSQLSLLNSLINIPIFCPWSSYAYYRNWAYSFYIADAHLTDAQKNLKKASDAIQQQLTTHQQPSSLQLK